MVEGDFFVRSSCFRSFDCLYTLRKIFTLSLDFSCFFKKSLMATNMQDNSSRTNCKMELQDFLKTLKYM
ncbi:hypothetical protein T03_4496 [Trichinella britovi]|uniref:Uncharacterized protein n=1 Tax=Trichinella britovi TaxID=45882 RepID=A0A0V1CWY5_TRIBR|nr:hypothetical protein T03_4496 [Trichinella britovi]